MNGTANTTPHDPLPETLQVQEWLLGALLIQTAPDHTIGAIYERAGAVFPYFALTERLPYFWHLVLAALRDEGLVSVISAVALQDCRLVLTSKGRRYYVTLRGLANSVHQY